MDLELVEEIGRAAGFTCHSSPRNYASVYAERDGADAGLCDEATRSATHQRSVDLAAVIYTLLY